MDVGAWLSGLGLGQYEQMFRDNDIDADLLPTLTMDDLYQLGVVSLGHRKRLLSAIALLGKPPLPSAALSSRHQPRRYHAERRQLTVMFVDLVGSTRLSSRLDPEDMREVLQTYQHAVMGEITRVGGHVAKLMGDGVLAYFGWPCADEDDSGARGAGRAGDRRSGHRLPSPIGKPLAARVGIATGLVVVGDLDRRGCRARRGWWWARRRTLRPVFRRHRRPGTVVISEGTRRLLGEMFDLRELGRPCLKGFAQPVNSYPRLSANSPPEAASRRAGRPVRCPWSGAIRNWLLCLSDGGRPCAGEGQAVLLVGEAGIGKSRLIRAVLAEVAQSAHVSERACDAALSVFAPSYRYGAVAGSRQLGFAAGLDPADGDASKLD